MHRSVLVGGTLLASALALVENTPAQVTVRPQQPIRASKRTLFGPQTLTALRPSISLSFVGKQGSEQTVARKLGNSIEVRFDVKDLEIRRGVYQVSSQPFEVSRNWRVPPGLLASGDLTFLPPPRSRVASRLPAARRTSFVIGITDTGVIQQFSNASRPASQENEPKRGLKLAVLPTSIDKIYVRVIGIDSNGDAITSASNVLSAKLVQLPKITSPHPLPSTVTAFKFVSARQTSRDYYRHVVVTQDISWAGFKKGQKLYLSENSGGSGNAFFDFLDAAGSSLGAFVDTAGNIVNSVSASYEDIRAQMRQLVSDILTAIITGVDHELVKPMIVALDDMFVAVGLPPTVGNVDTLLRDTDYYTQTYAGLFSTIIGSAQGATVGELEAKSKKIVNSYFEKVRAAANKELFRPDPDFMYRPASFVAVVRNGESKRSRKTKLSITDSSGFFEAMNVYVPALNPGQEVSVTVFLTPSLDPDRWIKTPLPPYPMPAFDGFSWNLNNGQFQSLLPKFNDKQKAYNESVKAWFQAIYDQEAMRKSWEDIYVHGKGTGGAKLMSEFNLSVEGTVNYKFKTAIGN
ncbi:MAG TPA: hypothetical protein VK171_09940 [Fimbriimonas sp.]|nr:hypothetical protein [Fimbriimonas sp.]